MDDGERRQHRRLAVRTSVTCRRLGRGGFDEPVDTLDLSPGGALLATDTRLGVGDVLALTIEAGDLAVSLRAMVVATRAVPGSSGRLRYVHVAFTGLSPTRVAELCRLLERWDVELADEFGPEPASAATPAP